jgi:DNA-binding NarL/FixJ family response regulator
MSKPRIIIADDHKIVVDGLIRLLAPDFEVVSVVNDGRELVTAVEKLGPDAIVVDISMPKLNGIEAVRQIKKTHKETKVIFLTMHPDVAYALGAFKAGASGYVLKHSASDELITAIRESLEGRTYVTPLIAGELLQAYQQGLDRQDQMAANLTSRQREVLQLIAEGYSIKDIAEILNVSIKNIEYHKYRMMEVLGIKTSAELVQYAVKQGIVASS